MAREDFEGQGGTGGIFAAYEFEVTDAKFEVVPDYMDGTTLFLHWVGRSSVDGYEVMTMDGYHPSFALGKDWITVDGGKTIQYQGKSRKPQYGKRYGMLVNKVADITEDVTPDPLDRIDPKTAASWIGSKWLIERYDHDFKGQIGEVEIELPTQFLGFVDASAQAQPQAAQAAAAPPPQPQAAAAPQEAPAPASNGGGDLRSTVVALAQSAGDFESFRTQALAIPGVTSDPALVQEVLDQTNGIFATKA